MACGVPVLGADSPGIREQIVHGETGWLCGTDPESIRSGIQCLLRDEQLRTRLAKNGRAFIEQNYSLERVAESEYNLLQEVTQGPIR
jgi:glycosyltransferase involved in cell wall biosynthesis